MAAVATRIHPVLEQAFAALDAAGVRWRLLRGEDGLALDGPRGGDVDLLVAAAHVARAHGALRAVGFARVPSWGRGGHRFYLAYHAESDTWARLDLDDALTYGPHESLPTGAADACLRRGSREGAVWVLHPSDAFWSLLLHALLDKHAVKEAYRARLRELAPLAETGGALVDGFAAQLPLGWDPARCVAAARAGDWDGLLRMAPELARRWQRAAGWPGRRALLTNAGLSRGTKALNLLRRRGLGVALLGPDGAGKSTVADGVRASFYFPTQLVYMGLYQHQERAGGRTPGLGLAGRIVTQWRRYGGALYYRGRGRLVIFDRYTYDHLTGPRSGASAKRRARRWLLAHTTPAPDLALVLDAPGAVLFARKGEHDVERLEAQRRQFVALAEQRPEVELVDATRDPEIVRREVVERIWGRYVARWS